MTKKEYQKRKAVEIEYQYNKEQLYYYFDFSIKLENQQKLLNKTLEERKILIEEHNIPMRYMQLLWLK